MGAPEKSGHGHSLWKDQPGTASAVRNAWVKGRSRECQYPWTGRRQECERTKEGQPGGKDGETRPATS